MLVVVNLDPSNSQQGTLHLDLPAIGLRWDERFVARDEVSGEIWDWGQANFVRLEPHNSVAHVVAVQRP